MNHKGQTFQGDLILSKDIFIDFYFLRGRERPPSGDSYRRSVYISDRNLGHPFNIGFMRIPQAYDVGDLLLALHSNIDRDGADVIEFLYKERDLIGFRDIRSPGAIYTREEEIQFLRDFCNTLKIGSSEFPQTLRKKLRGLLIKELDKGNLLE